MLVNKAILCILFSTLLVAISVLATSFLPHPVSELIKILLAPLLLGFAAYGIYREKGLKFIMFFCLAAIALKHLVFAARPLFLVFEPTDIPKYFKIYFGVFFTIGLMEFMASIIGTLIGFNVFNKLKQGDDR